MSIWHKLILGVADVWINYLFVCLLHIGWSTYVSAMFISLDTSHYIPTYIIKWGTYLKLHFMTVCISNLTLRDSLNNIDLTSIKIRCVFLIAQKKISYAKIRNFNPILKQTQNYFTAVIFHSNLTRARQVKNNWPFPDKEQNYK